MSEVEKDPLVGVVMGSESDWDTMQHCVEVLKKFDIPHEKRVLSAHRTIDRVIAYAIDARKSGIIAIIAGAGGAAHLPGLMQSKSDHVPVLGVPVATKHLQGIDSLLSINPMPTKCPVGTVAIGAAGAMQAGYFTANMIKNRRAANGSDHLLASIIGTESDWEVLRHSADTLKKFAIPHENHILPAHRQKEEGIEYALQAQRRGIQVIIAGSGLSAQLPGLVQEHSDLPVIAVPIPTEHAQDLQSHLAVLQELGKYSVATMAIGKPGAINAGYFLAEILANSYPAILQALREDEGRMQAEVRAADERIRTL